MPVKIIENGDLLDDGVDALVNAVNCTGASKAGIARQFAKKFPVNQQKYEEECRKGRMKPGKMFVTTEGDMFHVWHIINFPTRVRYKDYSVLQDIEKGLDALIKTIELYKIRSISIPALGCGYGKLNWSDVKPLILSKLESLPADIRLYSPRGK